MRVAIISLLGLGLSACAGAASPDGGVANYDALRQAQSACAARGGTFQLKTQGNSQYLEDYACKRD